MGRHKLPEGRGLYNKILFNGCRSKVDPQHQSCGEYVRAYRHGVCLKVTTMTRGKEKATGDYRELTIAELRMAIDECNGKQPIDQVAQPRNLVYASRPMQKRFAYSATVCALRHCDLSNVAFVWKGNELTGEKLRQKMQSLHDLKIMPPTFFGVLRRLWVNPKANAHLVNVGLRGEPADDSKLYDHQLTHQECDELISYFKQMHNAGEPVPTNHSEN